VITGWPCSAGGEEYALSFDRRRSRRLLVLPALFDEGNKLRHFTAEVMRRLDGAGIDSFLPDLPGTNESLAPLADQSLGGWRLAAAEIAGHFSATHVLTIRGGAMLAPESLPGWRYAPAAGSSLLRSLLRARILASREAGRDEDREDLMTRGREAGLELAGYRLGAQLLAGLADAPLPDPGALTEIGQSDLGGPGLWLRAEPDHDPGQADALAAIVAMGLIA
jgi:hypothetical protein